MKVTKTILHCLVLAAIAGCAYAPDDDSYEFGYLVRETRTAIRSPVRILRNYSADKGNPGQGTGVLRDETEMNRKRRRKTRCVN